MHQLWNQVERWDSEAPLVHSLPVNFWSISCIAFQITNYKKSLSQNNKKISSDQTLQVPVNALPCRCKLLVCKSLHFLNRRQGRHDHLCPFLLYQHIKKLQGGITLLGVYLQGILPSYHVTLFKSGALFILYSSDIIFLKLAKFLL